MEDFSRYELEIGKIDEKDSKLVLALQVTNCLNAYLEMHQLVPGSQYQNFSRFNDAGNIEKIVGGGDIYVLTDSDFVLSEPRLEIDIDCASASIKCRLSGKGVPSVPMPKDDIIHVISEQYKLAEKFLHELRKLKVQPKYDVAKLESESILEKVIKFDNKKYSKYKIGTF